MENKKMHTGGKYRYEKEREWSKYVLTLRSKRENYYLEAGLGGRIVFFFTEMYDAGREK
jgi:hypothetical protein